MPMRKRNSQAVPVLSAAGLFALTGGGAMAMAAVDLPADAKANQVFLSEEEVSDVSLATFYVYDKERAAAPLLQLARACRCGGGCARCAAGRCAVGRCAVGRCVVGRCAVGACAGCAGCSGGCGTSYCYSTGGCNAC